MALTRTARQVIDVVKDHLDIDLGRALQLLNEAHLFITGQVHLVPDTTMNVLLVAGTQEYSLPDSVVHVWDASYFTSATSWTPLRPTNVDTLYYDMGPNWQNQSPGEPWAFYERGGMIGFVPTPSATTAGGYPVVTLYYTPATNLGLDDTLPTNIPSVYPWVYKICELGAMSISGPVADRLQLRQTFSGLFATEMNHLREYMFGRVPRDRPRAGALVPRIRRA